MENLPRVFTRNFHGKQAELSRTAKLDKIMNVKPTISVIARIAPPVLIGVAIFLALKELFSGENKETKPETAPADAGRESCRKQAETSEKIPVFHHISPEIPVKPATPVPSAPTEVFAPPPPIKKPGISREDVANVFQRGARTLTRPAAVAALKKLGFGKTAAYAALSPDGRFADWLQFAPDGTITWTD